MPQPNTSNHLPLERITSTSAEGSVNGKNEGRKRTCKSSSKNAFKKS